MDVLSTGSLGVNELTLTGVVLLVLEEGNLEAASHLRVPVDEVLEATSLSLFDLLDRGVNLGSVSSASAVFELDNVSSICISFDGLRGRDSTGEHCFLFFLLIINNSNRKQ